MSFSGDATSSLGSRLRRRQLVSVARGLGRRLRPDDVQQQTFADRRLVARVCRRGSKQGRRRRRGNRPRIQPPSAIIESLIVRNDLTRPTACHREGHDERRRDCAHASIAPICRSQLRRSSGRSLRARPRLTPGLANRDVVSVRIPERELLCSSIRVHVRLLFESGDERARPFQ
jgi:hypothetical protein